MGEVAAAAGATAGETRTRLLEAEILSIGTELTVGETRDTNAAELARSLSNLGVVVTRIQAVPDRLDAVAEAFGAALGRAGLVVSTGGLGPTPDDLTREAIAAVCGEEPRVDAGLEAWLRNLWARRGIPFPELNLKQAWLIPSAVAVPNDNGTAPGWWVDRQDARVVVALPGPPREMRPMWEGWVLPRLRDRGLGRAVDVRVLRLFGIGESQVADRLGEAMLRSGNPSVATYARADAVDVRLAAVASDGRGAAEIANATEAVILERVGEHVWGRGTTTWADAVAAALDAHGWTLATTEAATRGALAALLASVPALRRCEIVAEPPDGQPESAAEAARAAAGAEVGVALHVHERGDDTAVTVAVATPAGTIREHRLAFLRGDQGRHRAALTAADILLRRLRDARGGSARSTEAAR